MIQRKEFVMTRTFICLLLYIPCLAATTWAQSAPAPDDRPDSATPTITARVKGSRTVVFESPREACNENAVPDSMARAFRDYEATVHLVASSSEMFQKHSCRQKRPILYESSALDTIRTLVSEAGPICSPCS